MNAIRLHSVVEKDGEVKVTGLPCHKGQDVEMIVFIHETPNGRRSAITALELKRSGLVGMWKDRTDISDSSAFARDLRDQAQRRRE